MNKSNVKKKIVLTGGGTAGHVYPALAIKERLENDYDVHYIGGNGMEKDILSKEKNVVYHEIDTVKLERKLTLKNFLIPVRLFNSIREAKKILKEINPAIIFSKGGFVSLPVVIAAKRLSIPVISHESDLSLGLANKIIFHFCNIMCTSFEATATGKKFVYTGQPIRKKILKGNKKNLAFLNKLDKNKPNLLIVGGSSGAKFLNEKIESLAEKLTEKYNVIHITGKGKGVNKECKNYVKVDYAENMGDFLDLADIVVSRAGSGAINEFKALKIPMLLIPLSKNCSRGDQIENAKLFKSLGLCEMIEEEEFNKNLFLAKLDNLMKNSKKYKQNMSKNAQNDACDIIIELISKFEKK